MRLLISLALILNALLSSFAMAGDTLSKDDEAKLAWIVQRYLAPAGNVRQAIDEKTDKRLKGYAQLTTATILLTGSAFAFRWARNRMMEGTAFEKTSVLFTGIIPAAALGLGGLQFTWQGGFNLYTAESDVIKEIENTPLFQALSKQLGGHAAKRYLRELFSGWTLPKLMEKYLTEPAEVEAVKNMAADEAADFQDEIAPYIPTDKFRNALRESYVEERVFLRLLLRNESQEHKALLEQTLAARRSELIEHVQKAK